MSIRLLLDGHNFSQASRMVRDLDPANREVVVWLDTPKTVLVPTYLVEDNIGADYLCFNGLEPLKEESVVESVAQGEITAIMSVDKRILGVVESKFSKIRYTSPLLEIAKGSKREVNIFLTSANAYIAVWDKRLRFAEVFADPSVDSVLYYLQVLGRDFKLKKFDINIEGEKATEIVTAGGNYFKNLKMRGCANNKR